jgi:DNA-binding PadR family transcriptional regulator
MYGALHRMESEGVIRALRTEQDGSRPARTVYEITPTGLDELQVHRDEALREVRIRPDPVDLALQNTQGLTADELLAIVQNRRDVLAAQLASWRHLRDTALPHLQGFEHMTFRHTELRLEAEIAWHDELLAELPAVTGPPAERRA